MKNFIYYLAFALALISCEKEPVNDMAKENNYVPGVVKVEFTKNARLKSAFDLVNGFNLEIISVYSSLYVSKLPPDSIDYIVTMLNSKRYLNDGSWQVKKNGDVYIDSQTGRIILVCSMYGMDKTKQTDWAITVAVLGMTEQPSPKLFFLKVPEGQEIYWRDKLRRESIVRESELMSLFYPD
jgi:hypothetical protein